MENPHAATLADGQHGTFPQGITAQGLTVMNKEKARILLTNNNWGGGIIGIVTMICKE